MLGSGEARDRIRERIIGKLIGELSRIVEEVGRSGLEVKLVGLTGSFARGDWHAGSDIDVIFVCSGVSGPHWRRLDLPPVVIDGHAVEYHIYSPEEFILLAENARMTVFDLFTEGMILHADKEYLDKVRMLFDRAVEEGQVTRRGRFLVRKLDTD